MQDNEDPVRFKGHHSSSGSNKSPNHRITHTDPRTSRHQIRIIQSTEADLQQEGWRRWRSYLCSPFLCLCTRRSEDKTPEPPAAETAGRRTPGTGRPRRDARDASQGLTASRRSRSDLQTPAGRSARMSVQVESTA